jgi:hypothetical protein
MTSSSQYEQSPSQDLIRLFAEASIARNAAIMSANAQLGNKYYDTMERIYDELKARGPDAQRLLLTLLDHVEPCIRCDAAMYALEFAPKVAVPVLRSLESTRGGLGMSLDSHCGCGKKTAVDQRH